MDHAQSSNEEVQQEEKQEETNVEDQAEIDQSESEETESTQDEENDRKDSSEELTPEQKKIQELEEEVESWKNRALRAQADLDNVRRRAKEEKESAAKYRAQPLVEALLPVIDNFERALAVEPESEEAQSLMQGTKMVYQQLEEALANEGLEHIEAEGESFDPHLHQAVMQVEEEGFEHNEVVEELQKGYKLKDRVIRPSMVKVNA